MATPGVCTNTAGYIANAEIQQIANDPSRVNYHFVDEDSHSNILVYDQTQWVGWMDDAVKAERAAVYQGLAMSGTADWATDLQRYNDPPETSSSWSQFKVVIKSGGNPASPQPLQGNWTSLTCKDHSVTGILDLTPAERWSQMGCEEAWRDLIKRWRSYHDDQKGNFKFSQYISALIYGPNKANCGEIGSNNCDQTLQCNGFIAPAAYEIWNSVVMVNEVRIHACNLLKIYHFYGVHLREADTTCVDIQQLPLGSGRSGSNFDRQFTRCIRENIRTSPTTQRQQWGRSDYINYNVGRLGVVCTDVQYRYASALGLISSTLTYLQC
jgi:hypothetical protein